MDSIIEKYLERDQQRLYSSQKQEHIVDCVADCAMLVEGHGRKMIGADRDNG